MTFGTSGAPASDTIYLDALLSTSLFNYSKQLVDNISSAHPILDKIKSKMEGKDGGVAYKQNLLYALSEGDTYGGYDEITILPTDGITQSTWEWRQYANSVVISKEEEVKNNNGLDDLLENKIMQVELGAQEFFAKYLSQGNKANNSSSTIETPYTNTRNGSLFIDPLPKLISYAPTVSNTVGGLDQSSYDWWQNRVLTMTATDHVTFMNQMDNMFNTCSLGVGGKPDIIWVDQITAEVWRTAYYRFYQRTADSQNDYPFPNFKFNDVPVVWDEKVPDVYSGTTSTNTYGSAYFINSKFLKPFFINGENFKNHPFQRPHNQNAKSSLITWMGTISLSNRKKQGVVGKIPRTLTA